MAVVTSFVNPDKVVKVRTHVDSRLRGMRIDRYSWWLHWREIADYIIPRRYRWLITPNQMNRGSPLNQRIIDSTGSLCLRTLQAGMMTGITSPSSIWFRMGLEDTELAEQVEVRQWLDEVVRRMMVVLSKSNFYNCINTVYGDLGSFGTAVMVIYEDFKDVIRCYNACAGEYYLANSSRMQINVMYREFTKTVAQVVDEYGAENCSENVRALARTGGAALSKEIVVAHAIEPNDEYVDGMSGLKGFAFREVYWEWGAGSDKVLRYKGFHEFPAIAPRWDVSGNDAYGRSPAMDALGDIKQLQVETKRKAQGIDKMVNPPLVAHVSLKNEPATAIPGGITYVGDLSGVGMKPVYEVKPDLQYMTADIQEIQGRIKVCMYYDLWLMVSQLDTVRSATEIAQRKEEKLIQLGPMLQRFHNEALDPALMRVYNIMNRARLFPPPPSALHGKSLQVEYISMLAEAQKAAMSAGLERLAAFVGNIAAGQQGKGGAPEALDNVDWDEMVDEYAQMLQVPAKVIKPFGEVLKMRAERNQQMAGQQMIDQGTAAVQGAKVLSETDVGGGQNALQQMMGG